MHRENKRLPCNESCHTHWLHCTHCTMCLLCRLQGDSGLPHGDGGERGGGGVALPQQVKIKPMLLRTREMGLSSSGMNWAGLAKNRTTYSRLYALAPTPRQLYPLHFARYATADPGPRVASQPGQTVGSRDVGSMSTWGPWINRPYLQETLDPIFMMRFFTLYSWHTLTDTETFQVLMTVTMKGYSLVSCNAAWWGVCPTFRRKVPLPSSGVEH
jgi:hypothetical protein